MRLAPSFVGIATNLLLAAVLGPAVDRALAGDCLPTDSGQWWQYRGNEQLSGRSKIKGKIDKPAIRWAHPLAGRETLLAAALAQGSEKTPLPTADVATSPDGARWGQIIKDWDVAGPTGLSWFDLDGKGQFISWPRSPHQKIGHVLPHEPGVQLIETEPKGYPKVPGVYKGTVRLKVRAGGQWVTRWETETPTLIRSAEPILGDFDADGKPVWSHDFEDFPGAPPPWNVPGLMYWQAGHFQDRRRMDLLVQMRRVGGESYLYPDMFCIARGRDECVFTTGNTVYAVGAARGSPASASAGAILWRLDLPGAAGPAAIADAEGTGLAQIVVACGDGHVYGIGSAESASRSPTLLETRKVVDGNNP